VDIAPITIKQGNKKEELVTHHPPPFTLPDDLLIRIGVPKDPFYLVESEVETVMFAHEDTGLPVPRVFCLDSSERLLIDRVGVHLL
jgi:hypothetical protein